MLYGDHKKQQQNTLMILAGGGESIARPITMSSSTVYLEVQYSPDSLERMALRMATVGH